MWLKMYSKKTESATEGQLAERQLLSTTLALIIPGSSGNSFDRE